MLHMQKGIFRTSRIAAAVADGEECTAVGAQRVGPTGLQTCAHGPYGFTWE